MFRLYHIGVRGSLYCEEYREIWQLAEGLKQYRSGFLNAVIVSDDGFEREITLSMILPYLYEEE